MSTQPPPGEGDNTKIILNGDVPQDVLGRLCEQIEYYRDNHLPITNRSELIKTLNAVENLVFYAEYLFLTGIGFNGPWPNALKLTNDQKGAFKSFVDGQNQ